jgi:hypothetical protein
MFDEYILLFRRDRLVVISFLIDVFENSKRIV